MKNKIEDGKTIDYTVPEDSSVKSGQIVVITDMIGIPVTDGDEGQTIALNVEGVYELPTAAGAGTLKQGQEVYVDDSGDEPAITGDGIIPGAVPSDPDDEPEPDTYRPKAGKVWYESGGPTVAVKINA